MGASSKSQWCFVLRTVHRPILKDIAYLVGGRLSSNGCLINVPSPSSEERTLRSTVIGIPSLPFPVARFRETKSATLYSEAYSPAARERRRAGADAATLSLPANFVLRSVRHT